MFLKTSIISPQQALPIDTFFKQIEYGNTVLFKANGDMLENVLL
jgi:hypothetical protein